MHVKHLLAVGALLFTVLEAAPLAGIFQSSSLFYEFHADDSS